MLTFQQFLAEKMLDAYKTFSGYVELFIDPSIREVEEIGILHAHPPEHPNGPTVWGRKAYMVRAILTHENLFMWKYDAATHSSMLHHIRHSEVLKNLMDLGKVEYWPLYLYYYPASRTGLFQISGYSSVDVIPSSRELRSVIARTPSASIFSQVVTLDNASDDPFEAPSAYDTDEEDSDY